MTESGSGLIGSGSGHRGRGRVIPAPFFCPHLVRTARRPVRALSAPFHVKPEQLSD